MEKRKLAEKDAVDDKGECTEKKKRETCPLRKRKGSVSEKPGSLQKQKVELSGLER